MSRVIKCTNEDNVSITLTDQFIPWELQTCEGIYEVNSPVNVLDDTMTDGGIPQGSKISVRNIVMTLRDKPMTDHQANRRLLYNVFRPKRPGVFAYTENGETKIINYYVEKVYIDAVKRARMATISLICPDPYFRDSEDNVVSMADWEGGFEFEHEFLSSGEEFGTRNAERLKSIENDSADDIGVQIVISASGQVTNPAVYHVEDQTAIKIGTEQKPFSMVAGDQVIITTHTNNKHVYQLHGGVLTEINNFLSEDSEFIQLRAGMNTFGYNAGAGTDYISVDIIFRYQYVGV